MRRHHHHILFAKKGGGLPHCGRQSLRFSKSLNEQVYKKENKFYAIENTVDILWLQICVFMELTGLATKCTECTELGV